MFANIRRKELEKPSKIKIELELDRKQNPSIKEMQAIVNEQIGFF